MMATQNSLNKTSDGFTSTVGLTVSGGAVSVNSGTNSFDLSNDASATTVNLATGGAAKVVTLGSTSGASSLALKCGTADFTLASNTGTIMSALDTGEITYPLQSAFFAYNSTGTTDVTGAGTTATIVFDTEVFDQNADFASNTYTAPVTGRIFLNARTNMGDITALMTFYRIIIVTSNRSIIVGSINGASARELTGNTLTQGGSVLCDMDAADTATVTILISNGAGNTADVIGDASGTNTNFSGYLGC